MWSPDEIDKREIYQGVLQEKKEIADMIIDNNQSKADTVDQVKDFWYQFIT